MKQKNVLLMVVAVACGLAAAVLTTQMTGKPAAQDQAEILVAAKELTVGTKLDKDKMAEFVKKKKVNKTEVPPNALESEEQLVAMYILRPLRAEDPIYLTDVAPKAPGLHPPEGKHLKTLQLPYANVGPFIEPGSKVDMFVTVQTQVMVRTRQFPLLTNVLVMAVDTVYQNGPQNPQTAGGRPQINTVTFAVTPEESKWLDITKQVNGNINLLVRGEKSEKVTQLKDDELTRLFFDPDVANNTALGGGTGDGNKHKAVKIWVPKLFLAAGTEITEEAIKDKFREKEIDEVDAPKDAVADLKEFLGKYLTKDVEFGNPLLKDSFGEKPVEKVKPVETPKVEPKPEAAPKPKKVERKPIKVWEPEISSPKGTEKHRYELYDEKEGWIYRGVVSKDGTVIPGPAPEKVPDGPKDEKGGKIS